MRERIRYGPPPAVAELPCPPARHVGKIEVLKAPRSGYLGVVALSNALIGLGTHWVGGRTRPHRENKILCDGCQIGQEVRWKGYLAGMITLTHQRVLVEVTEGAFRNCPALSRLNGTLRGRTLRIGRLDPGGKFAPVYVEVLNLALVPELPLAFDVMASLFRLWGYDCTVDLVRTEILIDQVVDSASKQA